MDIKKYNPFNWFKDEETRVKPFSETSHHTHHPFARWQQEMDKFLHNAFRGFGQGWDSSNFSSKDSFMKPNIDISESEKAYNIAIEVPGVADKDVNLEIGNGMLTISGEKKLENEKEDKHFYRVESSYGAFYRTVSLPEDVNEEGIEAVFKNGVLHVTLPRHASHKSNVKKIEIKNARS